MAKSISKAFLSLTSAVFIAEQLSGWAIDPCTNKALKQMLKGFPGPGAFQAFHCMKAPQLQKGFMPQSEGEQALVFT